MRGQSVSGIIGGPRVPENSNRDTSLRDVPSPHQIFYFGSFPDPDINDYLESDLLLQDFDSDAEQETFGIPFWSVSFRGT